MMLSIRYRLMSPPETLDEVIEDLMLPLSEHSQLDEVEVMVERRDQSSPPYLARVYVAVPGPDIAVEIADHTPENACRRAVSEIDRKLRERVENNRKQPPGVGKQISSFQNPSWVR